jgi:prenyltransferase beta subunit
MLAAASRAKSILENDAVEAIKGFVLGKQAANGLFAGRDDKGDIYYTLFGLGAFAALDSGDAHNPPRLDPKSFPPIDSLDYVHAISWWRCKSLLELLNRPEFIKRRILERPQLLASSWMRGMVGSLFQDSVAQQRILQHLERWRSKDGAWHHAVQGADHASAYGVFLMVMLRQDMLNSMESLERSREALRALKSRDGGYSNSPGADFGVCTATTAALLALSALGDDVDEDAIAFLRTLRVAGSGFKANALAPIPDLLSTATALFTLCSLNVDIGAMRTDCSRFVDELWNEDGGFCGSEADPVSDCEYTFYGLLALGCLA